MKLVIVESPTKARTISKFLSKDYAVKSSYGHIRDLPKEEMGVDIENNFTPRYIIPSKARTKVSELKEALQKSSEVILATDEDREGEAIAWHLVQALGLNASANSKSEILNPKQTRNTKYKILNTRYKRIVFHEITKSAIEKALENPRDIDLNLVDAQQARRILDRLVGYELSPFLWKKVKRGLSAGRVQSVALRFIVEREREIEKFKSEKYWAIFAQLTTNHSPQTTFNASLSKINEKNIDEIITLKLFAGDYKTKKTITDSAEKAEEIKNDLEKAAYKVKNISEKETLRHPSAPFTTSTLQQAAIGNLGFSAKFTMSVAQKLYEQGHITYMRTDSVNLSLESMLAAKKAIAKIFGKNYALESPRFYKTKSKGAQEAHEAIRPTFPDQTPEDLKTKLDPAEYKLYGLIWKRMMACQMPPAIFDSVKAEIEASSKNNYTLQANGSALKFDGFLKVYGGKTNGENILPKMKMGDKLDLIKVSSEEKSTTSPPRYSEATLIKVLEENGIGRPSTYAPTIATIIERKYVDKNEERRLYPLEIGTIVNDLLVSHFPEVVDIKFTATVEEDFDEIAEGKNQWVPVIRKFYEPFHQRLEAKTKEVKKEDVLEKLDRPCPECGGDLIVKFGRFGKFIACANFPNCRYTEKTEEEKKLDEENSGVICDQCGAPMVVKRGKYGAFLGCSRYPECKGIKKIENEIGMKCPKCGEGEVIIKKSKRGKIFYGCNQYPKCDFVSWTKPKMQ